MIPRAAAPEGRGMPALARVRTLTRARTKNTVFFGKSGRRKKSEAAGKRGRASPPRAAEAARVSCGPFK